MQLFQDQLVLSAEVDKAWAAGARNVMCVAPTGFGKTVLVAHKIKQRGGDYSAFMAHRQELITQSSLTLARNGIVHRIIAPRNVIQNAIKIQMMELGRNFYNSQANVGCVAVDTLLARGHLPEVYNFMNKIKLIIPDEAHHVQKDNKWGAAFKMIPTSADALMPTATPQRADGKGLGYNNHGLAHVLVRGPEQRWLIDNGRLCDYRLISQPSDMDFSGAEVGGTGDYSHKQLRKIAKNSHIVGDVAEHYLRFANGKLGVTFAPDLETAAEMVDSYNSRGVPAKLVSGDTPDLERFTIVREFRQRKWLQLVNVDLFGEGFDLPAIEVVSMARKTESLALFMQQFGRALRIMEGKSHAIIIDHVNNWMRHGLPDKHRVWSLEPREKRSGKTKDPDEIPLTSCLSKVDGIICGEVYERILTCCPRCGHVRVPASRGAPEFVDGVLSELDPTFLHQLRGEVARIDGPCYAPGNMPAYARVSLERKHMDRQCGQVILREAIAQWAGYHHAAGRTDAEIQKLFYWRFGVDVMTAQTLGTAEAGELTAKIFLTLPST